MDFAQQVMRHQTERDPLRAAQQQSSLESELLSTILNAGVLQLDKEPQRLHESDSGSVDSDELTEEQKIIRLRKKPAKLRKQLFEILLRKRVFICDRLEKIEKLLVHFGMISEQQLANQQVELTDREQEEQFKVFLKSKLLSQAEASSLAEVDDNDRSLDTPFLLQRVTKILKTFSVDDTWYELYKSVTNEKDMAERDQQKLVRREKRRLKKKQQRREERERLIRESLAIRAKKRQKENKKIRSTSADRYYEGCDHEYEQMLIQQAVKLKN